MAQLTLIVDRDAGRRARFLDQVERREAPASELSVRRVSSGCFGALLQTHPAAPVDHAEGGGSCALVLGEPLDENGGQLCANDLLRAWRGAPQVPAARDGLHATAAYVENRAVVCTDVLGLFPIYYAADADVLVVSTDAASVALHPLFPRRIDIDGLAGTLLLDALANGSSCWRDVRRLSAGHSLVWLHGSGAEEVQQYSLPVSARRMNVPFDEQVDALNDALRSALRRQAPRSHRHSVLLSGGRDSRLLAGYLHEQGDASAMLTFGRRGDFEAGCAARVARKLGTPHVIATPAPDAMPVLAARHARFDNLGTGFSSPHVWGVIEPLRALAPRVVTGHVLDAVIGGTGIVLPDSRSYVVPFDRIFRGLNKRGVPAAVLKGLLRGPGGTDIVDAAIERIRVLYERETPEHERAWRHQLVTIERLRIGSVPWRLSFGAWPVVPVLDRRVLELAATLPPETLEGRRAQDELLRTRFPALARLPIVDQNAGLGRPLLPSRWDILRPRGRVRPTRRGWQRFLPERRYNWRMYDFNGAGWRAIRRDAERDRDRLDDLFDMDALAAYLPPADVHVPSSTFFDAMGRKLLVGLILWRRAHGL